MLWYVVPEPVRSTRVKREEEGDQSGGSAARAAAVTVAALAPNRGVIAKILVEKLLSPDADVVENAADELAELCSNESENDPSIILKNQKRAYRLGAHGFIVQAMIRWNDNAGIQARCFDCITNLTSAPGFKLGDALFDLGVMEMIVATMMRFEDSVSLQQNGCGALTNLLVCSATCTRRFVNDLDGIHLLVKAMNRFPENPHIQLYVCHALYNISVEDDLRSSIIKGGAVAVVGKVLEKDFGDYNKKVQEAASDLMESLFTKDFSLVNEEHDK